MTPGVTVLIPTHDHARLVPYAVRSAQHQRLSDIEILVVGDGAPSETRDAIESIGRADSRVRYFDFPKGERHGERHRHTALERAGGRIVAYLCDDDLWLPDHLDNLVAGLADADFAHTIHTELLPDGGFSVRVADLAVPRYAETMLTTQFNYFGPTVVGHSMSAYRALPAGWQPGPPGLQTDLSMWRQFLAQPGIRLRSIQVADTINLESRVRRDASPEAREAEIGGLWQRLSSAQGADWYRRGIAAALTESIASLEGTVADLKTRLAGLSARPAVPVAAPPPAGPTVQEAPPKTAAPGTDADVVAPRKRPRRALKRPKRAIRAAKRGQRNALMPGAGKRSRHRGRRRKQRRSGR